MLQNRSYSHGGTLDNFDILSGITLDEKKNCYSIREGMFRYHPLSVKLLQIQLDFAQPRVNVNCGRSWFIPASEKTTDGRGSCQQRPVCRMRKVGHQLGGGAGFHADSAVPPPPPGQYCRFLQQPCSHKLDTHTPFLAMHCTFHSISRFILSFFNLLATTTAVRMPFRPLFPLRPVVSSGLATPALCCMS